MKNAINWFEIPVINYERAKHFYTTVIGSEIKDHHMPEQNIKYGMFTYDNDADGVGGGLIEGEGQKPTSDGPTIYLNGGDNLTIPLSKVEEAGGKIVMQKTNIGENGFMAQFIDTEGNRIALHSWN
ncbi:VOC family protein [Seonamhaeicola sp. MEBiC1930]|uniref:VOC family protein n=1 Tax=Seonamhaeicola sp. MEBiC01930 TaxID=2976768 RepID=UPI0032464833